MALPARVDCLIIGAGIHGLSMAWRPTQRLTEKGRGVEGCILAIDKSGNASGASGIAKGELHPISNPPSRRS